jgi:pSer/pThr/pTyr-binding forkhead associated (FHA) protein
MTAKLVEVGADGGRNREILIQSEEFLIGRGADCNLRLRVAAVSRHHCLLRFRGREASLADLGSSNGTFLNGKRVRSQTAVKSGDEIRLGASRFVVDLGDGVDFDGAEEVDLNAPTIKLTGPDAKDKKDSPR